MKILFALALVVTAVVVAASAAVSARTAPPKAAAATVLSAVVNIDGSLARGVGAVSAAANGVDGQYNVTFARDVSGCTYVASGGEASAVGPDDAVVFTVAPSSGSPNAVFVQEWDGVLGFDSYSSGFHLVVVC